MTTVLDPLTANAGADFVRMRVDLIDPNPDNPRRVDDKHPSLPGLAEAIKATGLINPITVRQVGSRCVILAGERRWRAARIAGLAEILVRVVDVTDEQAFHILNVENLQREDLHWTEEARGVAAMVKKGWDAATIARHLGRSEQWVRLRSKVATISPAWRKAVEDPESDYHNWPVSMLELIARFPVEVQEDMLKERAYRLRNCQTTDELQEALDEHYLRLLSAAPWAIDDAALVKKAGACSACPKRSSCQQQLFADTTDDRCLDAACWRAKADAFTVIAVKAAMKDHPKALFVADGVPHHEIPQQYNRKLAPSWEFGRVKQGTPGALPAIVVAGDKVGQVVYVKKGARDSDGGGGSSTRSSTGKPKQASPKERLAEFMKRRTRKAIGLLVAKLGGDPEKSAHQAQRQAPKAVAAGVEQPVLLQLIALAMGLGIEGEGLYGGNAWKPFEKWIQGGPEARDRELWDRVRAQLVPALMFDADRAEPTGAKIAAACCGVSWQQLVDAARDAMPLPKTLAEHFDQDGKPLKGLTTKPKSPAKPKAKAAAAKR